MDDLATVLAEACTAFVDDGDEPGGVCARCGWLADDHEPAPARVVALPARRPTARPRHAAPPARRAS